jgi:hypothetical protein
MSAMQACASNLKNESIEIWQWHLKLELRDATARHVLALANKSLSKTALSCQLKQIQGEAGYQRIHQFRPPVAFLVAVEARGKIWSQLFHLDSISAVFFVFQT